MMIEGDMEDLHLPEDVTGHLHLEGEDIHQETDHRDERKEDIHAHPQDHVRDLQGVDHHGEGKHHQIGCMDHKEDHVVGHQRYHHIDQKAGKVGLKFAYKLD